MKRSFLTSPFGALGAAPLRRSKEARGRHRQWKFGEEEQEDQQQKWSY